MMRFLVTVCSVLAASLGPQLAATAADRPNVILMMADDMGLGDTSAYQDLTGNSDVDQLHTPNMERLARMGVRFTDAHTPSSRCSPTRYGLLTGRYPWRNRLKYWVLFGAQGDPMIEADRPTLATLMRKAGYRTGMVGKWHVGLRYRRADGTPAAAWNDADLLQPLFDSPLDHGFDFCRITSRSHGTSGPDATTRRNTPNQMIGPGHVHGRVAVGATENGKQLVSEGPNAYVLTELGGRHSDNALEFLETHRKSAATRQQPFFLYYACNSNHGPHTPDTEVGGVPVAGAARSKSGDPVDQRGDFIYENDVALGRLLDYLQRTPDPARPGTQLLENTVVIFTSDNGAERDRETATGPFRSNKGSVYEGGHRVPFLVACPGLGIGDGDASTPGQTNATLMGLQDLYATFAEILGVALPDVRSGGTGAEDSISVLSAWRGGTIPPRPMFYNDHKEADDPAAAALRLDDPDVNGVPVPGQWKLFFDAALLRAGIARPVELYDLATDSRERVNRIDEPELQPLVKTLTAVALRHRNAGGHRLAEVAGDRRLVLQWSTDVAPETAPGTHRLDLETLFHGKPARRVAVRQDWPDGLSLSVTVSAVRGDEAVGADETLRVNARGLGVGGGELEQVDAGEALLIEFDRDVVVESCAIVAGNGQCGGFYRVGDRAPLAIYCVDADIDSKDQSGILSDIGVLRAGQTLRLDSSPHFGSESAGRWRLGAVTIRLPD